MEQLLKTKLGDCKHANTSNCNVKTSYERTTENKFYIYDTDDDQPVKIVNAIEDYQLTVANPAADSICVVKADHCLFTDETSKCDCLLFNNKRFYLVEIKSSSRGSRNQKRHKAVIQLGVTIQTLMDNGIDLTMFETKAIICFKKQNVYPIRASANTQRAVFLEKFKISLEEGNLIEF